MSLSCLGLLLTLFSLGFGNCLVLVYVGRFDRVLVMASRLSLSLSLSSDIFVFGLFAFVIGHGGRSIDIWER